MPVMVSVGRQQSHNGAQPVVDAHNQGPGIPPDVLPQLFGRHVAGGDGAGLGLMLSLARGITKAHGSELTVGSEAGKGTTFTLALPIRETLL
jgi:signal transduction histidine kinase